MAIQTRGTRVHPLGADVARIFSTRRPFTAIAGVLKKELDGPGLPPRWVIVASCFASHNGRYGTSDMSPKVSGASTR